MLVESQYIPVEIKCYQERFASYGAEVHLMSLLWGQPKQTFVSEVEVAGRTPETLDVSIDFTNVNLDDYVHEALRAGASGFLLKDTLPVDLLNAVRVVAAGDALIAPRITRRLIEEFARRPGPAAAAAAQATLDQLTEREREVLELVAKGQSNAEIAATLYVSHATVKTHVSRLLMKLDARDRAQLVMIAYETGVAMPGTT